MNAGNVCLVICSLPLRPRSIIIGLFLGKLRRVLVSSGLDINANAPRVPFRRAFLIPAAIESVNLAILQRNLKKMRQNAEEELYLLRYCLGEISVSFRKATQNVLTF